jgi:hypothetical protein
MVGRGMFRVSCCLGISIVYFKEGKNCLHNEAEHSRHQDMIYFLGLKPRLWIPGVIWTIPIHHRRCLCAI